MRFRQVRCAPEHDVRRSGRSRAGDVEIGVHNDMHGLCEPLHQAIEHRNHSLMPFDLLRLKLDTTCVGRWLAVSDPGYVIQKRRSWPTHWIRCLHFGQRRIQIQYPRRATSPSLSSSMRRQANGNFEYAGIAQTALASGLDLVPAKPCCGQFAESVWPRI